MELNYYNFVFMNGAGFTLETTRERMELWDMINNSDIISFVRKDVVDMNPIDFRATAVQSVQQVPITALGQQPKLFTLQGEVRKVT